MARFSLDDNYLYQTDEERRKVKERQNMPIGEEERGDAIIHS